MPTPRLSTPALDASAIASIQESNRMFLERRRDPTPPHPRPTPGFHPLSARTLATLVTLATDCWFGLRFLH